MDRLIKTALAQFKSEAEKLGMQVFAVALKGSQNYNLQDSESDIDVNIVFIPTFKQLRTNAKFKFEIPELGEATCHHLYAFAEIVSKGNPQWVEVCNTPYILGDLSMFSHYKVNPSALKGMVMEKVTAFDKLYPSREKYVKQFGYDPKQLHHIIRLYDALAHDNPLHTYHGLARTHMLDIKRGRFPSTKEAAFALRDEYISKLNEIYSEKKLAYTKQSIDYDLLDTIMMAHFCSDRNVD